MVRGKSMSACGDGLCCDHVFIGCRCGRRNRKLLGGKAMNSLGVMFLSVIATC
jgi:hypothetical protein